MLMKKVCMLGAYGVGKRSLTSRFEPPFSAGNYAQTISVRICKKTFEVEGRSFTMAVWDITDQDRFAVASTLLRGMSGYLLVADGTRPETIERVRDIFELIWALESFRKIPFLLLLNKCDLTAEWKIEDSFLRIFANKGWPVEVVSARENKGVEQAFLRLAREMLAQGNPAK